MELDNKGDIAPLALAEGYNKTNAPIMEPSSPNEIPPQMSRRRILKNVLVLSFAFMFLFTAFQSMQNLQSTLNKEEGLGTIGLAVIYAASMLAGLFLPPFIIGHLGCKWTLVFSMVTYILYMAANFYAVWETMIPASAVIGFGASTLWASKCTYLTQVAVWYAKHTKQTNDAIINRFFGVFFMLFQSSQIWGNLISSVVFSQQKENTTRAVAEETLATCGANYCPTSYKNNTNLDRPDLYKIYTLCGIYLGCACVAMFAIAMVLDRITLDTDTDEHGSPTRRGLSLDLLTKIIKHFWTSRYQKLLIPITIYSGIEQAFFAGDFTRSFVGCSLGIWNVGFLMIAYGTTDALCSLVFGRLVQHVGHIPFFILAFLVHGGSQIAMLLWLPDPAEMHVFYIFAILWGIGDAVIQTQINALYGYLFTEKPETAFASYRICESAGFILAFGYSSYLCTDVKLYICMTFLTVGMTLYAVLEIVHRRNTRQTLKINSKKG